MASDVNSEVSPSRVASQWLDMDLYAVGWEGLSTGGAVLVAREKCTILDWPGMPPMRFALLGEWSKNEDCASTLPVSG